MVHQDLTLLIFELNHMLDTGKYDDITIDEIENAIENGTILSYLADRAKDDLYKNNIFNEADAKFYIGALQKIICYYDSKDFLVHNKGVCFLLALTNEILKNCSGWQHSG